VLIQEDKIERLADNDIMANLGGKRIPMTFDSGAQISVVPIELVKPEELTGETSKCKGAFTKNEWSEGKVANVTFQVGADLFQTRALSVPGEEMEWTAILRVDISDMDMLTKINKITKEKEKVPEADLHYLPPRILDGHVQGAVLVSEGEVVEKEVQCVEGEQVVAKPQDSEPDTDHAMVEGDDVEVSEQVLAGEVDLPSVAGEAEGDTQGGSADTGMTDTITVESITSDTPRVKLAQLTVTDPTLKTARVLADKEAEGYHWEDDLLFRSRLDEWGVN